MQVAKINRCTDSVVWQEPNKCPKVTPAFNKERSYVHACVCNCTHRVAEVRVFTEMEEQLEAPW
jgi:hypothetical protein